LRSVASAAFFFSLFSHKKPSFFPQKFILSSRRFTLKEPSFKEEEEEEEVKKTTRENSGRTF
jgi:hypothetical protein